MATPRKSLWTPSERAALKKFGSNLRRIRESQGLTLEQAEERAKGKPSWEYLQKLETGLKNPTLLTLNRLGRIYRVPVTKLVEEV